MKKSLPLIFVFFLSFGFLSAQQIYKYVGIINSEFLFSRPSYCAKSQCIFLPADLTNATSGSIVTLYYIYGNNGTNGQTLTNYTIQMGQTTATSFDGANTFFTGLTPVLSEASYSIPAGTSGNWFPINLTVPFTYDATQTLIIQFTFDAVSTAGWGTFGSGNTPTKKIMSPDVNAVTGDASSTIWPNMGFDLAPVAVQSLSSPSVALTVFPNPSHDKLEIRLFANKLSERTDISLVNNLGEVVLKKEMLSKEPMKLDVSKMPRGIYFLRAKLNDREVTKRIVLE